MLRQRIEQLWAARRAGDPVWKFGPHKSILPEGQVIDHRSWRGDDWEFTVAVDFDTMQGPRTSLVAADVDGDGAVDLVVNSGMRAGAIPANSLPRGGRPNCRWFP